MAFKLEILSSAERDFEDALKYYNERSLKATKSFKTQLHKCYKIIKRNPWFEKRYGNIRALPMQNFPYLVLFEIDESTKTVYILSVFCTHQNPKKYP